MGYLNDRSHRRGTLTLILVLAVALSFLGVPWQGGVVHTGGGATFRELVGSLFSPDLSPKLLLVGLEAAWQTLVYAVVSISLALLIGLILGIPASGILGNHPLTRQLARALLGFLRAIHELVWAWLFVAAIGLSPADRPSPRSGPAEPDASSSWSMAICPPPSPIWSAIRCIAWNVPCGLHPF